LLYLIVLHDSLKPLAFLPFNHAGAWQKSADQLIVCVQNLAISGQNPLSCCPNLYNLLPVSIRAEHIFSSFETALKNFVRQRKFYTFEEYSGYMRNL